MIEQRNACQLKLRDERIEQRQFSALKRDRKELTNWAATLCPDEVVMESTGIYWKNPSIAPSTGQCSLLAPYPLQIT